MGFLYSWARIRDARIPAAEDFDAVRSNVTEVLYPHPGVVAASVYGSVARGDCNARSDFDLVVVCRNADVLEIGALTHELMVDAKRRHVLVSAHVHTVSEARRGQHCFGPSYRLTMRLLSMRGVTKGWPHQYLQTNDDDIKAEMARRVIAARRYMGIAHAQYLQNPASQTTSRMEAWLEQPFNELHYHFRPMHTYVNLARWILWWHDGRLINDGKQAVCETFLNDPTFHSLHNNFDLLWEADQAYDRLLVQALTSQITKREYLAQTQSLLEIVFPTATTLLRAVSRFMGVVKTRIFKSRRCPQKVAAA